MKLSARSLNFLLLVCGLTDAFSPRTSSKGIKKSLFSSISDETKTSSQNITGKADGWIAESIESASYNPLSESVVGPSKVLVYDTTLRDGTQGESISASCEDKLKIATRLAAFDVDYIEAGWPGSNPKDAEFFERAKTELDPSVQKRLVAFGSTRRKNVDVSKDPQIQALVDSDVPAICMVAKGHLWQATEILRATPEENLAMIRDSVSYLVGMGKTVLVDLEHFFDGYKDNSEYSLKCCEAAASAGASCLVLCDTNGGTMPWEVEKFTSAVVEAFPECTIGIHCHNDCGMAVANSVCASHAGVGLIQGTINGLGERTGNADLCSILPSLALHVDSKMACKENMGGLTDLSRYVDEILNRAPDTSAPFVGTSAFAHKGGLHVAAMERNPLSYQHIEPELVGNQMRVLVSELSGRQNIMGKMKEVLGGMEDSNISDRAINILNRVKELEHQGYTFEGAEASVHLMILHASKHYCPPFEVVDYVAQVSDYNIDLLSRTKNGYKRTNDSIGVPCTSATRATVKVRTLDTNPETLQLEYNENLQVSDGIGPVDALAKALMKSLLPAHPSLAQVELVDYKVRILDPHSATGAATRVMIEFRDKVLRKTWTTVSVDHNVISASVNALVDGLEYALIEFADACMLCDDMLENSDEFF